VAPLSSFREEEKIGFALIAISSAFNITPALAKEQQQMAVVCCCSSDQIISKKLTERRRRSENFSLFFYR
jgi:hypothetical protein